MQNPPIRFDAKQANKTCFIRFEANKYSLHIRSLLGSALTLTPLLPGCSHPAEQLPVG
jgi:hypothetical protein